MPSVSLDTSWHVPLVTFLDKTYDESWAAESLFYTDRPTTNDSKISYSEAETD